MKSTGKAACILPHGVLFRGNAEAAIRQQLVRSGYLKGIIGLPANLFYGTGIPACIVVLDKENAAARKGIFMIDASKGFMKDGNKNRLREQDIHRIVDTFTRQVEATRATPAWCRVAEIADPKNDYNLNLPRYIDSTEPEDMQDIDGHLRGGIPERDIDALGDYWKVIPGVRAALVREGRPPRLRQLKLPHRRGEARHLRPRRVHRLHTKPRPSSSPNGSKATRRGSKASRKDGHPKALIETIAEDLLATFQTAPLLDAYDVYQHLMDYWAETMQDDCYLIAADGWVEGGAQPREIRQVKNKEGKLVWPEPHDFKKGKRRFKSDLVPRRILIARYFAAERDAIDALEAELAAHRAAARRNARGAQRRGRAARRSHRRRGRKAEDHRQGREGPAQGDRQATPTTPTNARRSKTTPPCSTSRRTPRPELKAAQEDLDSQDRRQIPQAHRGRNQDAGGGRQMAGHARRRRAGRAGPRLADPHRPHPPAGRTLRHPAAAAHRRSGDARRPRGRTPQEDGGGMEVKPGYKQTEVGVIPEEWEVQPIAEHRRRELVNADRHCSRYRTLAAIHVDVADRYRTRSSARLHDEFIERRCDSHEQSIEYDVLQSATCSITGTLARLASTLQPMLHRTQHHAHLRS